MVEESKTGTPAADPAKVEETKADVASENKDAGFFSKLTGLFKKGSHDTAEETKAAPFFVSVERALGNAWDSIGAVVLGVFSRDKSTRRMSFLFIASCIGILALLYSGWNRYMQYLSEKAMSGKGGTGIEHIGEFFGKQAEETRRRNTTMNLGEFLIELKRDDKTRKVRGTVNLAHVEFVIECDTRETCVFLTENLAQARNQVTNVLTALDRDDLMTIDGKKRLKKALAERINAWMNKGKIVNIYVTKFIVG